MTLKRVLWGILLSVLALVIGGVAYLKFAPMDDPFAQMYAENCAVCHGERMEGGAQAPALVGVPLKHGESVAEIQRAIANGFPTSGMPAWSATMEASHIQSLAILIAEQRADRPFTDMKMSKPLVIPQDPIDTERATFHMEVVATGIDPYPFAIAPLPDGSILVTEKTKGLSIVAPDGSRSKPIAGTPATSNVGIEVSGLGIGLGWLLDVAPHPDYEHNGWIYLLHTDTCGTCREKGHGLIPDTMTRVVRGHIADGKWLDEEVIWSVTESFYTSQPDIGAGGRLAFDPRGYVFLTVGIKGGYFEGIQDLATPYGKIHRVHDDGRIPDDNPFVSTAGAMGSIWTYGHRSPQGLVFDPLTNELWGSEMGPRGGDEINLLRPGHNYGWPLYSKGVDYDGTPVEYGKDLGIEFDLEDIEQPVVDLTPSPAVSNFVIYEGDAFPGWHDQFIVGSLKATELYRFEIVDGKLKHAETLIRNLARIRDVAVGPDGLIYLLLEHESGSQIVKLVPEGWPARTHLARAS
jgi:glucose/arabinose dehydrogenase